MKRLFPSLLSLALLAGCTSVPTTPAVAPDGAPLSSSNKILSGTVQGPKLSAKTKVALIGAYTDTKGAKYDGLGRSITTASDPILSSPVKDGKYAFNLPQPPVEAVAGSFEVYLYNDLNDNNRIEADEQKAKGNGGLVLFVSLLAGYQVVNPSAGGLDAISMDKFNLLYN